VEPPLNFRLTIALVAAFVLLAGGVWYGELRNPATPTPPAGQATVFDLNSQDVTKMEVEAEGKRTVLERSADNVWRLTEPQPGEADNTTVDSAASRFAKLNANRKIDAPGALGDYGLANPTTKVRLTTRDGKVNELQIGAQTVDKSAYYAKLPGADAVYIVSSFTIGDVTKWAAEPPRPRPTPTAFALPSAQPGGAGTPGTPTVVGP
jgi:hypothetical protein